MLRIWKLGNVERNIAPTAQAFDKLKEILEKDGQGMTDIVWDENIDLTLIPDNTDSEAVKLALIKRLEEKGL